MLLNVSNHPSEAWSQAQREAAEALFRRVEDMPFPPIDPHATSEEVQQLAMQFATEIETTLHSSKEENAVHVMGELTFCVALVRLLQAKSVKCVASTTQRDTIEHANGTKTSRFQFVQFREYAH